MSPDAPTPDTTPTTDAPLLAGRYRLLDKLGEGGMGAVFRARDAKLDREVAVKLLPAGSVHDAGAVARFRREAKALARLSHPGIIQAYDSGEDGDKHFLVMELVEGRSLAKELAERGRVAPTRAADYARQAALALQHAHRNGLIHRDVKPSNLLVAPDGRVKLLDLGLARFLQDQVGDGTLTQAGHGMGTPDYCPPEQFRDAHTADPRSDVYSLGCTLYHLIAGRVPFPGSSMSEKVTAHETKEPPPLEESCPDMPAGLALVVQRMTAKRPAERFQSMAEVAEALAPYVATSSPSFHEIRNTSTWTGAQLSTMPAMPRRRRVLPWIATGVAALALLAIGIVGLAAGWFRPVGPQVAQNLDTAPADTGRPAPPPADTGKAKPPDSPPKEEEGPKAVVPDDPNVLTVSKEEKDGGKYRTIGGALKDVAAGQTVLVLDDATYTEALELTQPSAYAGVTLAAPRRATLAFPAGTHVGVMISNVSGVVLRGFRVKGAGAVNCLIVVEGQAPGVALDDLDLQVPAGKEQVGVSLERLRPRPGMPPVSVRNCRFHGGNFGLRVAGTPTPSAGLVIRENTFTGVNRSLVVTGEVSRTQVVANRFIGAGDCGIHLVELSEKSDGLLIANNSFADCALAVRLADTAPKGRDVRLCNNLILGSARLGLPDFIFMHWTGMGDAKPGDGKAVTKAWRVGHNWREVKEPAASDPLAPAWVPPDPKNGDVRQDKIDGVNRDAKSPDFLRPEAKSKLATDGAGNDDPSLPRYVGALPPEGAEQWDWDRAGRMPKGAQLLTVSKDEKDGGKYRTINEALGKAKPWATIRVLDGSTYGEAVILDDPKKQEGLALEAVRNATLATSPTVPRALTIRDVPHVRACGFRFRQAPAGQRFQTGVLVTGHSPGVRLERLNFDGTEMFSPLNLSMLRGDPDEPPVLVDRCAIKCIGNCDGILVEGPLSGAGTALPTRNVVIRNCRLAGATLRGVHIQGAVSRVYVLGNLFWDCTQEALGIEDLLASADGILVANNSLFRCKAGVRIWYNEPYEAPRKGQVELANNLIFGHDMGDVLYVIRGKDAPDGKFAPNPALLETWRFRGNWRDRSGNAAPAAIPLSPDDRLLDPKDLVARDPGKADFLRPSKGSPLAAGGVGGILPAYAGAMPPEATPAWDWDRTWRARAKQAEDKAK